MGISGGKVVLSGGVWSAGRGGDGDVGQASFGLSGAGTFAG